jgi:hypothetical protein
MRRTQVGSVNKLVPEYDTIVLECSRPGSGGDRRVNWDRLHDRLVAEADWTERGAEAVVSLARNYGSFMLRNALALAIALDIEDGRLGY